MHSCVIRTVEKHTHAAYTGEIDIYDKATFVKNSSLCYPMSGFVGLDGQMLSFAGIIRKNTIEPGYIARFGLENKAGEIDKVFLLHNYGGIDGYYSGIFMYADVVSTNLEQVIKSLESTLTGIRLGKIDRSDCTTAEFEIGATNFNYK